MSAFTAYKDNERFLNIFKRSLERVMILKLSRLLGIDTYQRFSGCWVKRCLGSLWMWEREREREDIMSIWLHFRGSNKLFRSFVSGCLPPGLALSFLLSGSLPRFAQLLLRATFPVLTVQRQKGKLFLSPSSASVWRVNGTSGLGAYIQFSYLYFCG